MIQAGKPSVRAQKRAKAEARLFEHGLALMGQVGVYQCKVEQITKAAGVGKGTFFTYFGSKEAFVARLVERVLSDLARRVRPVTLSPTDAEALLSGVGAVHLRYFQLRPNSAALVTQAVGFIGDSQAGRDIKASITGHLEDIAGMIAPACAALGWPEDRNRELALSMLALSCGLFWFGPGLDLAHDAPTTLLDRLGRALARGLKEDG